MANKLDRRDTYRFSADHLGPLATILLRLAEQVRRSRGPRLTNTVPVHIGGRDVTLFGFGDLAIYLEIRTPGVTSLYLVVDRLNLPDWFVRPTGTWFELLDLD